MGWLRERDDLAIRALHVAFALAAWAFLWRAGSRMSAAVPELAAFPAAVLVASTAGSMLAIASGATVWSSRRALAADVATFAAAAWWIVVATLGPWSRDLAGISVVLVAAVRLAPAAIAVATGAIRGNGSPAFSARGTASRAAPAWLAFGVALAAYASLAVWLPAASLPLGDQVHYLLAADRLRAGSLDATIDDALFRSILGIDPREADRATHEAVTSLGVRPVQGYAMPLLLLPGWAIAGRLGAHLVMALVAAWASLQTLLILRDLSSRGAGIRAPRDPSRSEAPGLAPRIAGWTWVLASFLPPLPLLATHLYPNAVGAALVGTAFRYGFTAPVRRPALAAALLTLTLFLTPRDGLALLVLLPFLLRRPQTQATAEQGEASVASGPRSDRNSSILDRIGPHLGGPMNERVVIAAGAVVLAAILANAVLYGLPVPYAGYVFGTGQAQELTREPSITPRVWIGLPAMLFDRTFGLAGSAPWVFIGLLGLALALRRDRERLVPAALAVGASAAALSFFRYWEGGYAPPGRYLVDVLPLWAPFVAYGLVAAAGAVRAMRGGPAAVAGPTARTAAQTAVAWAVVAVSGIALAASALATLLLDAIPDLALNTAFDHKLRDAFGRILGIDPLGWLPSFQPTAPDWYVSAYVRLLPALAIAAVLLWYGRSAADRPASGAAHATPPSASDRAPSTGRPASWRSIAVFFLANAFTIALVLVAGLQSWLGAMPNPVPASLLTRWLPLSLALATAGTALVARSLPPPRRSAVLARHFLLYLVPLALMLLLHAGGPDVVTGQLGAIYLLVAIGFAANALAALWTTLDGGRHTGATRMSDRSAALQLAAAALVVYLVVWPYHRAFMPTASDEPHYLLIVQSLLYDGDLDLRNDYDGDRYAAFYPTRLPDMHGIELGGAVYSVRDLGLPILSLVPFAIGGRLGVLGLMCVVGATLAGQLYLLLRDLRLAQRVALLGVATTALTHPILTYTTQVYPELLTALVFVSAARLLRRGASATLPELAMASALVGILPWLSTRAWPIVVGVGLVVAWSAVWPWWSGRTAREGGRQVILRVAAGALPFAALVLALAYVNWRMFGLFLPSAGYFLIREQQQVLTYTPQIGGTGLLFDRVFGLIPRAPVYLLAFVGALQLWRRARGGHGPELAALAVGATFSFAYIADIAYWWADGSPPSRYFLASLPLLVAAVAFGWDRILSPRPIAGPRAPAPDVRSVGRSPAVGTASAASRVGAVLAWLCVIASLGVAYVYAVLPNIRYDLVPDIRASGSSGALFSLLGRASGLDPGQLFPSLVRPDPTSAALAAVWLAIAAGLAWLGRHPAGSR